MKTKTIELLDPIKIDGKETKEIEIREPNVMSMQGLEISSVIRGDVSHIVAIVPRITDIDEATAKSLSFRNLAKLSVEITNFLDG